MQTYYVYVDYRLDTDSAFYVGVGTKRRVRNLFRNSLHDRIANKHSMRREIVYETTDRSEALNEEVRLIRKMMTRDHQGGANFTDGGEGSPGWVPTLQTRLRMRRAKLGRKLSDSHKRNMSRAHVKRYESPEERKKVSEVHRRAWSDPDYHSKMCEKRAGIGNSQVKLTESDVRQIREEWNSFDASSTSVRGFTKTFCQRHGDRLGVTSENIYGIIKERSWRHLLSSSSQKFN